MAELPDVLRMTIVVPGEIGEPFQRTSILSVGIPGQQGPDGSQGPEGPLAPFADEPTAIAGIVDDEGMSPRETARAVQANVFPTRTELLSRSLPAVQTRVMTTGYSSPHDGGGAEYQFSLLEPAHPGKIQTLDGRWFELQAPTVDVAVFGAVGNAGVSGAGGTNDAAAFQAASDYLSAKYGGGIITYQRRHLIASNITIARGVSIQGLVGRADPGNPFGISAGFFAFMRDTPALVVDPAATVALGKSASGIKQAYLFRSGMSLDGSDLPEQFAGTAVVGDQINAHFIEGCTFVGFHTGIYTTHAGRGAFRNNLFDCLNGIHEEDNGDYSEYTGNRGYGITQAGATGHEEFSLRDGYFLFFGGDRVAGPKIDGNFCYGYNVGIFSSVPGSYTLSNAWVDGPTDAVSGRPLNADSYGIIFSDGSAEPQMNNVKLCSQNRGVTYGVNIFGASQASNVEIWNCNIPIDCRSERINLTNIAARGYDTAIKFSSAAVADSAKIVNAHFQDRRPGGVEIDCANGDPQLVHATYDDGQIVMLNPRTAYGATSGSRTLADGTIVKWGLVIGSGSVVVTWPGGSFPNGVERGPFITMSAGPLNDDQQLSASVTAVTSSGCTVNKRYLGPTAIVPASEDAVFEVYGR